MRTETAIFGGGCFWCLEAIFRRVDGVYSVECGYAGGHTCNPDYDSVCRGTTGHAEVVKISFNPDVIQYETLLTMFFSSHDPTTLNRQGNDVGTQYRSMIVCADEVQQAKAADEICSLNGVKVYASPVVTEVRRDNAFYPAESYHQNYFAQHPEQGYCTAVINPKLARFRALFADKLKR